VSEGWGCWVSVARWRVLHGYWYCSMPLEHLARLGRPWKQQRMAKGYVRYGKRACVIDESGLDYCP